MRVMLDTNVLFQKMNTLLTVISMRHTLVLSSFVVDELREVVRRKFPAKEVVIDTLLSQMSYELVYTSQHLEAGLFSIRDDKDYLVLYTAIVEGADILITGDKDFAKIEIDRPEILTPAEFLEQYC